MTKALAILNSMRELELKNELSTSGTDAAIVELEEAMKPKTCDGCKSYLPYRRCKKDVFRPQKKDNTFGCNKHEPKDNA